MTPQEKADAVRDEGMADAALSIAALCAPPNDCKNEGYSQAYAHAYTCIVLRNRLADAYERIESLEAMLDKAGVPV